MCLPHPLMKSYYCLCWQIDLGSSNPPVVRLCHPSIAPSENCFDIILGHAVIHCKCKEEEQMRVWVDRWVGQLLGTSLA